MSEDREQITKLGMDIIQLIKDITKLEKRVKQLEDNPKVVYRSSGRGDK